MMIAACSLLHTLRDGLVRMVGFHRLLFWGSCLAVVVGILGAPSSVQAQSNGEGTIYSRFGMGSLLEFSSSQSDAMGGGGYALRSLNYNPDANPALWSDQVFTRLSGSAAYRSTTVEDGQGNSGRLSSGNVQALQFNFPLYERSLGVGFSFQPYSRSNYSGKRLDSEEVSINGERREVPFETEFSGSGGLHRLRGGLGYRVNDMLSVGATADLLFGTLERRRRTTWAVAQLRNTVISDGVQLSGLTSTLGGHLALADVFAEDDAFSIGASVTLPANLSGERFRTLDEDLARDTLATERGDVTLPWKGRLGLSYQPNARWTLVVDGAFDPWSTFSSDFSARASETAPARFPAGGTETLTDRWRLSTGAEVVPAGDDRLAGYFAQAAYRFGGYAEQMYVRPDSETTLYEFALTAGISLPTSLSGTRIDLNTVAGTRGTTTGALVRDQFFGVSLHVNFGERWFQRRKLR
ncbi:outer membrane protein transport protein [Salinibacter altiplanensis]|uniref:outer membrane protein transport protein n=1 Tax=Salinibacter altiplanensis TaxID=1803181 RepID=UPI001E5B4FED|nr:outer membrane protein transport protein [Salinibacter altiplanensis]